MRNDKLVVVVIKKEMLTDGLSFIDRCFINKEIVFDGSLCRLPQGFKEGVYLKIIKSIFSGKSSKPTSTLVSRRYLEFILRYLHNRWLRERLVKKLLGEPAVERRDYPIGAIPEGFPEFSRKLKDACEEKSGFFETSWYRRVSQVSSFGEIKLLRYSFVETENDSSTWWISQFRSTKVNDFLWVKVGFMEKEFKRGDGFFSEEILDVKMYDVTGALYIKNSYGWHRVGCMYM